MSLDVYLTLEGQGSQRAVGSGIFVREGGATREVTRAEWDEKFPGREPVVVPAGRDDGVVFQRNITHNLTRMAGEAGLYEAMWHPTETGIIRADQLITPLETGLALLEAEPERFRALNPENGWGTHEGLIEFVRAYLSACREYPAARVSVSL